MLVTFGLWMFGGGGVGGGGEALYIPHDVFPLTLTFKTQLLGIPHLLLCDLE